jgi:putative transposase
VARVYSLSMSKIAYSTRLVFESETDKQKIVKMLEAHRFACNECSKVKFDIPQNSIVILHAAFYRKFRDAHPEIPSHLVIRAEQKTISYYRIIKSCKHKLTRPPEKKRLSIQFDQNGYTYKRGTFSIISLEKRVKCKPHLYPKLEAMLNKYRLCDPELFYRSGNIWINMVFDIPNPPIKQTLALGIDLGCRVNAATSEGILYADKKFNKEKRRLRYLKRCLSSKAMKGSRSANRHFKKLRYREKNKNKNFTHHLANRLLQDTKADVLVIENLRSVKVKKNRYHVRNHLSQIPLYQLKQFLTYKAPLYGKTVMEVCPSYTSLTDSQTGKRDGERRGRRYYSKTGVIYDADVNAAINIGLRSKLPVSLGPSNRIGTYGQAKVSSPIVGGLCSQVII